MGLQDIIRQRLLREESNKKKKFTIFAVKRKEKDIVQEDIPQKKEVFCKTCKYFRHTPWDDLCTAPNLTTYRDNKDAISRRKPDVHYSNARRVNVNNDCKYYIYSLWKRILNIDV